MQRLGEWVRRISYLIHRDRMERELQQEMELHRSMMTDPSRFGNALRLRESARDTWGWTCVDRAVQDVRLATRRISANRGYALAIVLTLVLGIGINTAVFSMIDGFTLRALPYQHPERVAALVVHREGIYPGAQAARSEEDDSFDGATWDLLKHSVDAVTFAAYGGSGGINLRTDLTRRSAVIYTQNSRVSADYFDVLGVPLSLGRSFTPEEDSPQGPAAAVLSHRIWNSVFNGDPQIIGHSVEIKGEPHTIVGVLAPNAVNPAKSDVFTPLRPSTTGECGGTNCGILVRLKPERSWPELNAQLNHIRLPYFAELETRYHGRAFVYARPLQVQLAGSMANRTIVLMFAVGFILAIACANLAGLVLVRVSRHTREIATLLALGATAFDVLRQLWIENLLLAVLGGAGGVGVSGLILHALKGFLPDWMIPIGGFAIDGRVLGFALSAAFITSVLFGAVPALRARRIGARSSATEGSRTVAGGSVRWRQWLIGTEIALTVVLLAAAGLMVRTLIHLETVPAGFDAHNVLTAKVSLDDARYRDEIAFHALLEKSVSGMKRIPGVEDAAIGLSVPYERGLNMGFAVLDGPRVGVESVASLAYVTPEYFSTLRIPLLAGRIFKDSDNPTSLPVAVVNVAFGSRFFNSISPIGNHIRTSKTTYTIVGVVSDVAKRPGMNAQSPIGKEPVFYLPAVQAPQALVNVAHIWFQPSWIVRTAGPIAGLRESMQHALADADPGLPFAGFYSMEEILADQLQLQRVEVVLLSTLAGLALLLSAIGIYALVSNLVVQRRREIGIRIALGSGVQRIMVEVGSSGVIAAVIGLIAGFVLSLGVLRVLSGEIYGTTANDPLTLVFVMLILIVTAITASLLPTLRISRIQPAETLRAE